MSCGARRYCYYATVRNDRQEYIRRWRRRVELNFLHARLFLRRLGFERADVSVLSRP